MTRTSSKTYDPESEISVLVAGLVSLSSVFSTGTEASGDEPVLVGSRPSGFAAEETIRSVAAATSRGQGSFVPSQATTATESVGLEEQDLVSTLSVPDVMQKLERFRDLEVGWNGYGAPTIPDEVIDIAKEVASRPEVAFRSPEVYPTGRRTVQFEFRGVDGSEVELEIFSRGRTLLLVDPSDEDVYEREASLDQSISFLDEFLT